MQNTRKLIALTFSIYTSQINYKPSKGELFCKLKKVFNLKLIKSKLIFKYKVSPFVGRRLWHWVEDIVFLRR